MDTLITWLIGSAENITDIEFFARCIVLVVIVNFMSAVASLIFSAGR